jgi:hypothetical protein
VAFLGNLFNRKEHSVILNEKKETADHSRSKEEYLEDEDLEDTTKEGDLIGELESEEAELEEDNESDVEYEVVEREILPAKIICPDCGGITLEGLEFCDKCGGEL